jgi:hypothetical protein
MNKFVSDEQTPISPTELAGQPDDDARVTADATLTDERAGSIAVGLIYQEVGNNWRYFLEWRHRMLVRLFVLIAALALAIQWLTAQGSREWLFVVFLAIAYAANTVMRLDRRNAEVAAIAQAAGMEIEKQSAMGFGFYSRYPPSFNTSYSYTNTLRRAYRLITLCASVSTIVVFLIYTLPVMLDALHQSFPNLQLPSW